MWNAGKAAIEVRHADMEPATGWSMFRRKCQCCEGGVLMVKRDSATLRLQEYDRCIQCAQAYRYLDIDLLRQLDGEGIWRLQ